MSEPTSLGAGPSTSPTPGAPARVRLGLRARLVGVVVSLLALLLASMATVVLLRAEGALLEIDEAGARAATEQLAESVVAGVLARSELLLDAPVAAFARTPELVELQVLAEGGTELVRRAGPGRVAPGAAPLVVEVPVISRSAPVDEELGAFGIPAGEAQRVGFVRAQFSQQTSRAVGERMRRDMLLAFAGLGGVALLLVFLLASGVVRRVRALAGAASRVAGGDFGVRVDAQGSDELSGLGSDFNAMAGALEEQRRALDDAAQALAERESLAAIGRATAVIAHELKNPLGIVLGAAQVVGQEHKPEAARRRAAGIVEEEVRRLDVTLRQLLDYARPRVPTLEPLDPVELATRAATRATLTGGPAEHLDVSVVAEAAPSRVRADEAQVAQILLNLIANAAQAGAQVIRLVVEDGERKVGVAVVDDGPGVSPEVAAELFRPFVTSKQRGAGLGLSASRRMARDQGGDLVLDEDHPGPGARFVLTLPLAGPGGERAGPPGPEDDDERAPREGEEP